MLTIKTYPHKPLHRRILIGHVVLYRDVVLTKKVWERTLKIAILKQLQTHFKAKREKGVGAPFPPHYTPAFILREVKPALV